LTYFKQNANIDKIAPTYTITPIGNAYGSGYQTGVVMQVTCVDNESGIASGSQSPTFTTHGNNYVSGTCVDNAGNSANYSYSYRVQKYEANASVCGTSNCNPHSCNCRNECAEYGSTGSTFIDAGCPSDPVIGCPCCTGSSIPNCWVYDNKCGGWQTSTGCIRYENRCDTCYDQCANSCWF